LHIFEGVLLFTKSELYIKWW